MGYRGEVGDEDSSNSAGAGGGLKAVVQTVLLYVCNIWVVTRAMLKVL